MEQMDLVWMTNNFTVFLKTTTNIASNYEQKVFSHHFLCFYCQLYLYAYDICIAMFPRKPLSVQSGKYLILKENLDSYYDLKSQ